MPYKNKPFENMNILDEKITYRHLVDSQPGLTRLTLLQNERYEDSQYIFAVSNGRFMEPGTRIEPEDSYDAYLGIIVHSKEQAMAFADIFTMAAERLPTTNEYYEKHPERFVTDSYDKNENDNKKEDIFA